jgi:hypothetical protein
MSGCKTEDDCPTPMWCRGKDKCPNTSEPSELNPLLCSLLEDIRATRYMGIICL